MGSMGNSRYFLWLIAACWAASQAQVIPDLYVLELSEPPAGRERGARRIREAQGSVRQNIAVRMAGRVAVQDTTEVVMNSLIVKTNASAAELAAIPGVWRVWPVFRTHAELDRAVKLLGVSKAWDAAGGADRAGAGIKIGIVDSGLDLQHAGFRAEAMTAPRGYPRASNEAVLPLLNGKVIVYRNYEGLAGYAESPEDRSGHGTGVAMAAAGMKARSPYGEIQGVAPGAWLGVYKIFAGADGKYSDTAMVTKALDDAVADGMDVVNLSVGVLPQLRAEVDPMRPALERMAALGVMVVKSNGNSGPARMSGSSPAIGLAGLTVGAAYADRLLLPGIRVNGGEAMEAVPGDGPAPAEGVTAGIVDAAGIDGTGLACKEMAAGALAGKVVLIASGGCGFETKLEAAQRAGAVAAVIYAPAQSPDPTGMIVGQATLPAVMVGNQDGVRVKAILAEKADSTVEIVFDDRMPIIVDSEGVLEYSARGPGADGGIRPDLVAVGEELVTAAQKGNPTGELYHPSGYTIGYGTSFAAALVTGGYAVLKAGRPGLSMGEYRSLLMNNTQALSDGEERAGPVQTVGAGRMDVAAALAGPLVLEPTSLGFGFGGERADMSRVLRLQNVGIAKGRWKVEVDSGDEVKATVEPEEISLGVQEKAEVRVRLRGELKAGEYQGYLLLRRMDGEGESRPVRVPYWYGVPSGRAASVSMLPAPPEEAEAGSVVELTALITDAIGASIPREAPRVTVLEGGGQVVGVTGEEATSPGYWKVRIRMGPLKGQVNRVRVEAGPVVKEIAIRGS
jgi:hypothetical protein